MEYDKLGDLEGVPIRTPADPGYRWCDQCGSECQPEPTSVEGLGVRLAFVCDDHGVNCVVDPFEGER